MDKLVEYLEEVKHSETENPPKRINWNNNSSGLKKTKKGKCKRDKNKKSQDVTDNSASYKKSRNRASSAKCLVTMLNCIPLIIAIKKLLSGLFDEHKKNAWTGPRRKSFVPWQKLSRGPL
eukprot:15196904-Ditylum_brightwellii.AAC.1